MSFVINNLNSLICPITHEIFIEPVIASDCHTYERTAIINWLKIKQISPITYEPMSMNSLRSNLIVKYIIEELLQLNEIKEDIQPPPIPPRLSKISRTDHQELNKETNDIETMSF